MRDLGSLENIIRELLEDEWFIDDVYIDSEGNLGYRIDIGENLHSIFIERDYEMAVTTMTVKTFDIEVGTKDIWNLEDFEEGVLELCQG